LQSYPNKKKSNNNNNNSSNNNNNKNKNKMSIDMASVPGAEKHAPTRADPIICEVW